MLRTRFANRWTIGWAVVPLGMLFLSTAQPGCVSETGFSPDRLDFRTRSYVFYSFLGVTKEYSFPLADRVREFDDGLVPPTSPPRWCFAYGNKRGTKGWIGEGRIPHRLFRNEDWLKWTDENPELAKRFWPKIIHLLRQERYSQVMTVLVFVPDAKNVRDIDHAFTEAEKE